MSSRHNRNFFFMAASRQVRGEVSRPATPSEADRAFRFSEIVQNTAPQNSDELLTALAEEMTRDGDDIDSHIPAGFTYLGQFIDHDLTMDITEIAFGTPITNPADLKQARSPALDLDSLYGDNPSTHPQFYATDGIRLKTGSTIASPPNEITNRALDHFDLPRFGSATANPQDVRKAQIPDHRNDENLAVAQTHLAFIRFHNRVCDRVALTGIPGTQLFERARELVVKHYQWIVRTDFLPRIVDDAIIDDVFRKGRKIFEVDGVGFPTMPLEFSVAAYRLGHAMIRDKYDWNSIFSPGGAIGDFGTLLNLFQFSGTSGNLNVDTPLTNPIAGTNERLSTNWIADWTRLYDFVADGTPELAPETSVNRARPLDIRLTNPLRDLPPGSFGPHTPDATVTPLQLNLAFRNLVRGRMVGLANAQEVFDHIASKVPDITFLTPAQILGNDLDALSDTLKDELVSNTPLWFYILREASLNLADGKAGTGKLTGIGGRIVAEVFHRAIEGGKISILRDPEFRPTLGTVPGVFRMTDLLRVAYDASKGELRPLSPSAPRPAA